MATAVEIEVTVNDQGVVSSLDKQTAKWQEGTAKWGAAVDQFKVKMGEYTALVNKGGQELAIYEGALNKTIIAGRSFSEGMTAGAQALAQFHEQTTTATTATLGHAAAMREATATARVFGAEMGVGGGIVRGMAQIAARSETLGPLLSAAFPVIGAVGLGMVAVDLASKLADVVKWTQGLTKEVENEYQEVVKFSSFMETHFSSNAIGQMRLETVNSEIEANERQKKGLQDLQAETLKYGNALGQSLAAAGVAAYFQKQLNDANTLGIALDQKRQQIYGQMHENSLRAADDARKEATAATDAASREFNEQDRTNREIERAIAERDDRLLKAHQKEVKEQEKLDEQSLASAMKIIEEIQKAQDKAAADQQKTGLDIQKLDDQVFKHREDAQIAALPKWQQANARIIAIHAETIQQLNLQEDEFVRHHQLTTEQLIQVDKDYQAERVAADQKMQAELVQQHQQMVDKLANQLDTFFNDIFNGNAAHNFLKLVEKFGEKMLASLLLGINNGQGQSGSSSSGGIFGSSILGGLLGKFLHIGGQGQGSSGGSGGGGGLGSGGESLGFPIGFGSDGSGDGDVSSGSASTFGLAPLAAGSGSGGAGIGASLAQTLNNAPLAQVFQKIAPNIFSHGIGSASGAAIGAAGAEVGLASLLGAYSTGSKTLGVLGGAAGGALLGFSVGGPLGAVVGGAIGAIAGLFAGIFGGNKKRHQAEDLESSKFFPALDQLQQAYENYQLGYADEQKQMQDLENQAQQGLGQFGSQGDGVYQSQFLPRAQAVQKQIDVWEKERERRSKISFAPPEFHDGGEVPAILLSGETVMNRTATSRHRNTLRAMNEGSYAGGGGDIHIHIDAIDAKSVRDWLRSGGAREIQLGLMREAADYAGGTAG